jgi:hypothetical protein
MELDQDGHHLARTQAARTDAVSGTRLQQGLVPLGRERLPEIIDSTKQFQYTHGRIPLSSGLVTRKCTAFFLREVSSYPELDTVGELAVWR